MAVQQRIIGGGLLLVGITIALILIFLFHDRPMDPAEAYGKLKNEVYPAYLKAEDAGDYVKMQAVAEDAEALMGKTAMAAVLQEMRADAARGDREARGLLKLLEPQDVFERNIAGQFGLDGGWYDSRSHATLRLLKKSLDEAAPGLIDARRAAKTLAATFEQLRLGSGLEIPLPAADASAKDPVAAADAQDFRVFAVPPADVKKALATKGAGAKANSARLVWNQNDATDDRARLAEQLARLPRIADSIERAAVALGKVDKDLKGLADATKQAQQYLKTASDQLHAAVDGPARPESAFSIPGIIEALRQEARTLKACAGNGSDLGAALSQGFAQ
ncbi:MAG TPA: hypothetical protein VFY93_11975 [Planctomycetota bacterium]|nr:hypothetical protein [Planctomycetota bacterium]